MNDSLGHAVGDKLLAQVANRLEGSLRQTDTIARVDEGFTIARLGGDEFAIILNDLTEPADANVVAERLLKELSRPFVIGDKELFSSMSIGIALSTLSLRAPGGLRPRRGHGDVSRQGARQGPLRDLRREHA